MAVQGETFGHRPASARGVDLVGMAWRVDHPRATVILAHGVNEHIGRYGGLIAGLTGAGFSIVGHDHRGHGRSDGRRGHIDDFEDFARDLVALFEREHALAPEVPLVALGHSMGGLIATQATLMAQGQLAALVLSAPALRIGADMPAWQRRIFLLIGRYLGDLPSPAGKAGVLSRDPAIEAAFAADALSNHAPTRLRLVRQIHLGGEAALARAAEIRLPLLAMHGTADTLTDPTGSADLVARASSPDKELKRWADNRHELLNDLDKAQVLAYLLAWVDARFPRVGEEGGTPVMP